MAQTVGEACAREQRAHTPGGAVKAIRQDASDAISRLVLERRIHGHRHAGVRIVQEGPTLLLALDAHLAHPEPFSAADVWPYRYSPAPACQREAMHRRKMMRRARSKKKRPMLLAELERKYLDK